MTEAARKAAERVVREQFPRDWKDQRNLTAAIEATIDTHCVEAGDVVSREATVKLDERHPEDYCHKCGGPNISWYAPSLLWNQFVRAKGEPRIICPICFAQLASEVNVTWSMVPETVTSDYDERLAVRAAQRIINATIQSEREAMVIVRDALAQSAAALAAATTSPVDAEAIRANAIDECVTKLNTNFSRNIRKVDAVNALQSLKTLKTKE